MRSRNEPLDARTRAEPGTATAASASTSNSRFRPGRPSTLQWIHQAGCNTPGEDAPLGARSAPCPALTRCWRKECVFRNTPLQCREEIYYVCHRPIP
jgi:hypothetical protein